MANFAPWLLQILSQFVGKVTDPSGVFFRNFEIFKKIRCTLSFENNPLDLSRKTRGPICFGLKKEMWDIGCNEKVRKWNISSKLCFPKISLRCWADLRIFYIIISTFRQGNFCNLYIMKVLLGMYLISILDGYRNES